VRVSNLSDKVAEWRYVIVIESSEASAYFVLFR